MTQDIFVFLGVGVFQRLSPPALCHARVYKGVMRWAQKALGCAGRLCLPPLPIPSRAAKPACGRKASPSLFSVLPLIPYARS